MKNTVVFACDDNYAKYLAVTMASLIDNFDMSIELEIIVFDAGISDVSIKKLYQLKRDKVDIRFIEIDSDIFLDFPLTIDHISVATYFRLKLPSLLSDYEKVVYLDVDILINKDISPMWDIDLNSHAIGAVQEPYGKVVSKEYHDTIGIHDTKHKYFNAGILVMDLEKLRSINFEDSVVTYLRNYKNHIEYQDQDILNGILQGNVEYIHPKYNYIPSYRNLLSPKRKPILDSLPYSKEEVELLKNEASIYHYCGKKKPWMYGCTHHGSALYLKYQKLTAWNGLGLLNKEKTPITTKLLEAIRRRG